jgi:RNase P subunit RPR2
MELRLLDLKKFLNLDMSKKSEKIVCHECLSPITHKTGALMERNNWGIPHFIWVCKKCKK